MSSNRAAMEAIVSVRSIPVYGDSTEYPPGQISLKTFMKWAAATRTDLQSYPALNAKLCLLSESITRESMTVLWTCTDLSGRGGPVDDPSDAVLIDANFRTFVEKFEETSAPINVLHIALSEGIASGAEAVDGLVAAAAQTLQALRFGERCATITNSARIGAVSATQALAVVDVARRVGRRGRRAARRRPLARDRRRRREDQNSSDGKARKTGILVCRGDHPIRHPALSGTFRMVRLRHF